MWFTRMILVAASMVSAVAYGHQSASEGAPAPIKADSHAPVGVMGDHRHQKGEWMLSYRQMQMRMDGNMNGRNSISDVDILSELNPFPGPATVRVVPDEMVTRMHMIGLMYAPSDQVTLMAMVNYLDKDMNHVTYAGMTGATPLGEFRTSSRGLGDTKLSAMWGLYSSATHNLHLNLGVSVPTGSISAKDTALTPMNTSVKVRLPYAMQLGSGTWDAEPGITYRGASNQWGWGAQYSATVRVGENSENYALGDAHYVTTWGSYRLFDGFSVSARFNYRYEGDLDGLDKKIAAPVTTANPDNYGGERLLLALGANLVGQRGLVRGHRLAFEYQTPLRQDVNGIQMELDDSFTLSYQYAF